MILDSEKLRKFREVQTFCFGKENRSLKNPGVLFWGDESCRYDVIKLVRDGISYNDFINFFSNEPFSEKEWSAYLGISKRAFERYKNESKNFPSKQSERIIEIKLLLNYGESVFENWENFMYWMSTNNIAMGGVIPKELLDTTRGIDMVNDHLGRIEHGIFA